VILRVKDRADSYLIEVEDDGAGMTEEQIKTILLENDAASSGVGLVNIQRRLFRFYGTQLTIQSQLGKGTRITLILPKGKENT
jgi:sensor histidine kinase YesM